MKILILKLNQTSDIKALEKVKFEKSEILDLTGNKIPNINILEKVNFPHLKELNLFIK